MPLARLVRRRSIPARLIVLVAGAFVGAGTILPLAWIIAEGLLAAPQPTGFGLDWVTLSNLVRTSVEAAVIPALVAAAIAIAASCLGVFSARFRRFYRIWICALLFTNPVFLVLGLSVLTSNAPPLPAIILVTAFVLLPLVALPVQTAIDQVSRVEIDGARSLGSGSLSLIRNHLLPALSLPALVAVLLGSIFALGFYLLPTFVGYGQVPTLGASIYVAVNRLGNPAAAAQLAILMLAVELLLIAAASGALLRGGGRKLVALKASEAGR